MDIADIFFFGFLYPFTVKPVLRIFRIAVEPEFRVFKGTSCDSLFDERAGHKNDFIKEYAAERHALNESGRAFITPAKEIESIFGVIKGNLKEIGRNFFTDIKADILQGMEQRHSDISFNGLDGFTADGKRCIFETEHSPGNKGYAHTEGFAASDGTVTDNAVTFCGQF